MRGAFTLFLCHIFPNFLIFIVHALNSSAMV